MGSRGSLDVHDKAVGRIAEAATLEVSGVAPADSTTSALGSVLGRAYPRVDCQVAGRRVRAEVEVVTHWPQSTAKVAAAVRDHVAERLRTLADLEVDAVEVHVVKVIRPATRERIRVR